MAVEMKYGGSVVLLQSQDVTSNNGNVLRVSFSSRESGDGVRG